MCYFYWLEDLDGSRKKFYCFEVEIVFIWIILLFKVCKLLLYMVFLKEKKMICYLYFIDWFDYGVL